MCCPHYTFSQVSGTPLYNQGGPMLSSYIISCCSERKMGVGRSARTKRTSDASWDQTCVSPLECAPHSPNPREKGTAEDLVPRARGSGRCCFCSSKGDCPAVPAEAMVPGPRNRTTGCHSMKASPAKSGCFVKCPSPDELPQKMSRELLSQARPCAGT